MLYQVIAATGPTLEVGFVAGGISTVLSLLIGVGGAFIGGFSDEALNLFTNIILVHRDAARHCHFRLRPGQKPAADHHHHRFYRVGRHGAGAARPGPVDAEPGLHPGSAGFRRAGVADRGRLELLPNMAAFIVSGFIFTVIFAILTQAGLAFLGLGNTNLLSWGNMLYWAQADQALTSGAWWWFAPPGLCIALLGTGLSLVNFGLDEVLNPRLCSVRPVRRQAKAAGSSQRGPLGHRAAPGQVVAQGQVVAPVERAAQRAGGP